MKGSGVTQGATDAAEKSRVERDRGAAKAVKGDAPASASRSRGKEDVALLCGRSRDGQGVHVLRRRSDQVEFGTVRPLEDGQPLHGEVVQLTPREGQPLLCDVEVKWAASDSKRTAQAPTPPVTAASGSARRPAQVATDTYRKNWEAIWKHRQPSKLLN